MREKAVSGWRHAYCENPRQTSSPIYAARLGILSVLPKKEGNTHTQEVAASF